MFPLQHLPVCPCQRVCFRTVALHTSPACEPKCGPEYGQLRLVWLGRVPTGLWFYLCPAPGRRGEQLTGYWRLPMKGEQRLMSSCHTHLFAAPCVVRVSPTGNTLCHCPCCGRHRVASPSRRSARLCPSRVQTLPPAAESRGPRCASVCCWGPVLCGFSGSLHLCTCFTPLPPGRPTGAPRPSLCRGPATSVTRVPRPATPSSWPSSSPLRCTSPAPTSAPSSVLPGRATPVLLSYLVL